MRRVITERAPAPEPRRIILGPQPGFQEKFAGSRADITFGGGSAGCGKTFISMLDTARHYNVPGYYGVFFRKNATMIHLPGGLWDESMLLYPQLGGDPHNGLHEWRWPSTAKIKMAHLDMENTKLDWQGSQVARFTFDELTHFSASQFWYMLSRNRSTCGVRPKTKATMNPDADSWVAELIAWWIDQREELESGEDNPDYGFPLWDRSGVLRYFARLGDEMLWGDSADEVASDPAVDAIITEQSKKANISLAAARDLVVLSLTFIPGRLDENKILEQKDPSYRGKLLSLPRVERMRLLYGNWKVRTEAGDYFKRTEFNVIDEEPRDVKQWVRSWDLAATEPHEGNMNPDWTTGVKMGRRENGRFVIAHGVAERKREDDVRKLILNTAAVDGRGCRIRLPEDPGQAGKAQKGSHAKMLAGYNVVFERETGDKETRARPFSSQVQAGNVDIVRGPWNAYYFTQMEGVPQKGCKWDYCDASSGGFRQLDKRMWSRAAVG